MMEGDNLEAIPDPKGSPLIGVNQTPVRPLQLQTACASRLVDLCHTMTPDELATFQRSNRDSHFRATKGGAPPQFGWFLDQLQLSARAGFISDAVCHPGTLLAALVTIGVDRPRLVAEIAHWTAEHADEISYARHWDTLYNLSQLIPGHLNLVDQARSAAEQASASNAEAQMSQRLRASICRISNAVPFEWLSQAPGNTIAKYLYAVSHLGVPHMKRDFLRWERILCDYRNKEVLQFDTAALTMLAQVYRKEGAVGTKKNPFEVFHKIAVLAQEQSVPHKTPFPVFSFSFSPFLPFSSSLVLFLPLARPLAFALQVFLKVVSLAAME